MNYLKWYKATFQYSTVLQHQQYSNSASSWYKIAPSNDFEPKEKEENMVETHWGNSNVAYKYNLQNHD